MTVVVLGVLGVSCGGTAGSGDAVTDQVTFSEELVVSSDEPVEGSAPLLDVLGNPFSGDTLANLDVGGVDGTSVSYRFVAETSGLVASVRPFIVVDTSREGYAAGTGGTVSLSLVADDGAGLPDLDQVLATGQIVMDLVDGHLPEPADTEEKRRQNFSAIALDGQPVTAGEVYHIVFEQVDPDPVNNYVGLDLLYQTNTELGPRPSIEDWGVTIKYDDTDWQEFTKRFGEELYTPIMSIQMEDGYVFGNGYIEPFPEEESYRPVNEAASIRIDFTPVADFEASEWWLRALRISESGVLEAHLIGTDGTDEVVEIPADLFPTGEMRWVSWPWARTFSANVDYVLTLTGADGGAFSLFPLRDGADYNYEPGSYFNGISRPSDGNGGYEGWHKGETDDSFISADIMMAWTT